MPKKDQKVAEGSSYQKGLSVQKGIKSRARVRDRGEVFTNEREVNNILALTQATSNRYWRFLEPACGNGNFLEAILCQRLEHLKQDKIEWHAKNREFSVLKILSTIYGVDIAEDNIAECKKRLRGVVFDFLPKKTTKDFLFALEEIMRTNLIVGDMLNGKEKIFFVEYSTPAKGYFKRSVFALTDMENGIEKSLLELPLTKFTEMEPIDFSVIHIEPIEPPPKPKPKSSKQSSTMQLFL